MNEYDIAIRETMEMTVTVEAASREEDVYKRQKKSYGASVAKMKNCEERSRKWFIKSAIQRNGNRIFR